jgi:hypothetical protein
LRPRIFVLALSLALAASSVAFAQRPPPGGGGGGGNTGSTATNKQKIDEAMPHFTRGVELYDENDFSNALIEFKRAYDIAQDYHVLFNVAQTYYQMQNYAGALDSFQRYLTQGGTAIARDRRLYVEKEVQKLAGRVAMVRITVNVANAEISVDDEKVGVSPLDHAVMVSQGKRKIAASVQGKPPASKVIEVAGGDSSTVDLDLEKDTPPPPPPPPPPPVVETRRRIPWAVWGITGGLFVAWGATGVIALVFSNVAQTKINTYPVTQGDISSAQDLAKGFALASDISLGCTVVAASVAFVLTLLAKPEPVESKPKPSFGANLYVSPFGATVLGHF